MPIQTNLSVSPHFDDYDENKDFYKILFRPGVAVQARELNQLQTVLAKQIERFGDHVFKRGTVVDGCDITFQDALQYAKLKDNQADGAPVNVAQLVGYYIKDTANVSPLVASVQTVIDGFEARAPDLKTIYVKYINSGFANVASVRTERQQFVANDTLTVFKPSNPIEKITSFNNSGGFSNLDSVVILSSLALQNSTGGTTFANNISVGQFLSDGAANTEVVAVDTTSNSQAVIVRLKPQAVDLNSANTQKYTYTVNTNVQALGGAANSNIVRVVDIVGSGASAVMRTGSIGGEIDSITVTQGGSGYYVLPTVSIQSTGANTNQITTANLISQTFLTQIVVANSSVANAVGTGYGLTVGKGVLYQKGYFTRVNEHFVVVEKYSNTGFDKAVGFDTTEAIINSNQDTSLLDNATGEPNATAPGANRLKLTPRLVVKTKAEADANNDFFSIVEFSQGNPYKQIQQTQYNVLSRELARRTEEESGDYVVDPFRLATDHATSLASEANSFVVLIDPGVAYLNGIRRETQRAFRTNVQKGTDTFIANTANISLNYGNYIRVNELAGLFQFNTGDLVSLFPNPADFISSGNGGTVPASGSLGTALGTARIRSLVLESGVPGTASCVYRLYLFDIRLATARNFSLVKSIFYNGTFKGVADSVLENGVAVLKDNNLSSLLYSAGRPAVKSGNNFSYVYRTVDSANSFQIAANGTITITATGGETFPYTPSGTLSPAQEQDIIIAPMANVQFAANAVGSITCNATSVQINGTSTTFDTLFEAGDYIKIANSTANIVRQIAAVTSNTVIQLTTNATAFTGANGVMFFPQFVPFSLREDRSANVDSDADTLFVHLGSSVNVATNISVAYNIRTSNTTPVQKTVNRDKFIRLQLSNNAVTNTGPWALGVSDIFHLKGVFSGANATFDSGGAGVEDITNEYYIDHNQNENFYGMSYLYRKTNANTAIPTSKFLLVKFDHFTHASEGLKAPGASGTYNINDTLTLANSSSTINTLEIPEVYSTKGVYYDLRDQFDFRPISVANATPSATAASAPINPTEKTAADRFGSVDKKFPAPDSNLTGSVEYYLGRTDRVILDRNGDFNIMKGTPGLSKAPATPSDALTIDIIQIPPYPSHPENLSADTISFFNNKIANETYSNRRMTAYRVKGTITTAERSVLQPRGYTMVDIGSLDSRIKALEYYVSFTLVETLTQNQTIASSSNSAIPRVKFGFFVDGFNNYNLSEITNPQYNAAIVNGCLSPKVEEINLPLFPSGTSTVTLPFVEKTFIAQRGATDGAVVVPDGGGTGNTGGGGGAANTGTGTITTRPSPQPVVLELLPTVIVRDARGRPRVLTDRDEILAELARRGESPTFVSSAFPGSSFTIKTIFVTESQKNRNRSDSGQHFDEFFYTFSSMTGAAEFYITSRDNNLGVQIFQSTNENGPFTSITVDSGRNNAAEAAAITDSDITSKNLGNIHTFEGRTHPIQHPGSLTVKAYFFNGTSVFIQDQFKLLWTHNPDLGRYYKVRVYKGEDHGDQNNGNEGTYGFKMFFPINVFTSYTQYPNGFSPTTNYNMSKYIGHVGTEGVSAGLIACDFATNHAGSPGIDPNDTGAIEAEQAITLTITGLKPDTNHVIIDNGIDRTFNAKEAGKILGDGLQSDENGTLSMVYYINSDIQSVDEVTEVAAATDMRHSTKAIVIENTDGSSSAQTVLPVKTYIKPNATTTDDNSAIASGLTLPSYGPTTNAALQPQNELVPHIN